MPQSFFGIILDNILQQSGNEGLKIALIFMYQLSNTCYQIKETIAGLLSLKHPLSPNMQYWE